MPSYVRALVAPVLLLAAFSTPAAVWFGDEDGVHRVDTNTNRADLHIDSSEPVSLSVNSSDGSVWSLTRTRVTKYASNGSVAFSRSLSSYSESFGTGRRLAVNAANGTAWIGGERRLLHVSPTGTLLSGIWGEVTDLGVAQDGTAWVLDEDENELRRYANEGALLSRTNLSGASARARYMALDDTRGLIWLGGERSLVKRKLSQPSQILRTVSTSHDVNAISLDVETGELWVLGDNSFYGYRADGNRFVSEYLGNDGISDPETLAFDLGTQALWIGHRRGISRFTRSGQRLATIRADEVDTVAVSRAAVVIDPTIALVAPAANTVLTNTRPTITFQYGATCSGAPCAFPPSYFATFSVNATLDGTTIGPQFTFDANTGRTSFTPAAPLAQGPHQLTGQARDSTGKLSPVVTSQFTVDSVPPQLVSVTPASGGTFPTGQITVAGSFDATATRITLNGAPSPTAPAFSFTFLLGLGVGNFTLVATDAAGNETIVPLTYTYAPPNTPPTVSIVAPANGETFTVPASVPLVATASDPDGSVTRVDFFRNGSPVGSASTPPYLVGQDITVAGTYTFTAVATDDRGATSTSAPVTVTVGPANAPPIVTMVAPANGASVMEPVELFATASDPDGAVSVVVFLVDGVTVSGGAFNGTGYVGVAFDLQGTHTFTAQATDNRGATTTSAPVQATVIPFRVEIQSPQNGATVSGESVLVTGTFSGPVGTSISVSDVAAALTRLDAFGGTFAALVPVSPGSGRLDLTITAPNGRTMTSSVFITVVESAFPLEVKVAPVRGFSPLAVQFALENLLEAPVGLTFNGSFIGDLPGEASATIPVQFPVGTHIVTLGASAGGASAQRQYVIESVDRNALDQQLRAMWAGMNNALLAGNIELALTFVSPDAHAKYRPVFEALLPDMPAIIGSYSALQLSTLTPNRGVYGVNRTVDGVNRLFLINFLRGTEGAWRITAM